MSTLAEQTGGAVVFEHGLPSQNGNKATEMLARYVATRIFFPYTLSVNLPLDADGKLKLEVVDESGQRDKNVRAFAAERLPEPIVGSTERSATASR